MNRLRRLLALTLVLGLLAGCQFSPKDLMENAGVDEPPADYVGQEDGFRYAKSTLSGQERYLYDQLLEGIQAQSAEIDGLYPDTEMIQTVVNAIDRDYPELFWFSGTGQIETTMLAKTPLEAAYQPIYTMDQDQRAQVQTQIDQWAENCFATLPQQGSDYEKALGIYAYLIDHADYQVVDNNSIINIMVNGAGLCGCYAKTFQYLCNRLGINTTYITGQAGGDSHAWNLSWLDGVPCWIDPTWGDPVFSGGDSSFGPAYGYFGLTTADLLRTHTLDDTVPVPDCTDDRNNYFIREGLYFTSYSPDALCAAFQRALTAGTRPVSVRYDGAAYGTACRALLDRAEVNGLLQRAGQLAGRPIPPGLALSYTKNDTMGVLTFLLPAP